LTSAFGSQLKPSDALAYVYITKTIGIRVSWHAHGITRDTFVICDWTHRPCCLSLVVLNPRSYRPNTLVNQCFYLYAHSCCPALKFLLFSRSYQSHGPGGSRSCRWGIPTFPSPPFPPFSFPFPPLPSPPLKVTPLKSS